MTTNSSRVGVDGCDDFFLIMSAVIFCRDRAGGGAARKRFQENLEVGVI